MFLTVWCLTEDSRTGDYWETAKIQILHYLNLSITFITWRKLKHSCLGHFFSYCWLVDDQLVMGCLQYYISQDICLLASV